MIEIIKDIKGFVDDYVNKEEFDYRDSCGANSCECYDNSIRIDAIIAYLQQQWLN